MESTTHTSSVPSWAQNLVVLDDATTLSKLSERNYSCAMYQTSTYMIQTYVKTGFDFINTSIRGMVIDTALLTARGEWNAAWINLKESFKRGENELWRLVVLPFILVAGFLFPKKVYPWLMNAQKTEPSMEQKKTEDANPLSILRTPSTPNASEGSSVPPNVPLAAPTPSASTDELAKPLDTSYSQETIRSRLLTMLSRIGVSKDETSSIDELLASIEKQISDSKHKIQELKGVEGRLEQARADYNQLKAQYSKIELELRRRDEPTS